MAIGVYSRAKLAKVAVRNVRLHGGRGTSVVSQAGARRTLFGLWLTLTSTAEDGGFENKKPKMAAGL